MLPASPAVKESSVIMRESGHRLIPVWVWALLSLAVVSITLFLFFTDRRPEPGPALIYDISEYEAVDKSRVIYAEVRRIPVNLRNPAGLVVAGEGNLLVAGDTALLVLDPSGGEITRRDLDVSPQCVAAGSDGIIYLGVGDHVAMLPSLESMPVPWAPLGERSWLTSITVNERFVYAADSGNARILQYDRSGKLLREIGGKNDLENPRRFIVPSPYFDMAIDGLDMLWSVNPGRLGVENYREDGTLASAWHQPGMGLESFSGCCNPAHIAFKRNNVLVTAEKGINRVKTYGADHSFLGVVATPELLNAGWSPSGETYELAPVRDLAVDDRDRILVLHGPLHCILVFEESPHQKESP